MRQNKGVAPQDAIDGEAIDARVLDAIYRSEAPRLTRIIRGRLFGSDDPGDVVQEAFVRIAACAPGAAMRRPEAYLNRIVRNLLIDRSRRHARRHGPFCVVDETDLAIAPDQAHAIEVADLHAAYRAAVDNLAPRTRQVFLLHRADELDYRTIADKLGISVRTVEWHIAQALTHLDKALRSE